MEILMDARVMGTRPSGIGMYIYYLVKELSRYPEFTFALITDVSESDEMKEMNDMGMTVYEFGKSVSMRAGLLSYYRFVQKCIDTHKPDIFWEGNILVPMKIRNPYGKLFTTIYDMFPLSDPDHFPKLYSLYFRYGVKKTLKYFDKFIFDSQSALSETIRFFPETAEKDTFVGYVIVPKLPELPISDNGDFLYLGNLETRKGTDILLKAYHIYRSSGGTRGLRVAGKIQEEPMRVLMDEISAKTPGLTYLGYISEEQRNQEYASCHAFVFPSRAEGFGIPIIEAMNYNKPVIAGELDTLKEVSGDCISFFRLDENADVSALRLAQMMSEEHSADEEAYRRAVEFYDAPSVGRKYREMLLGWQK